MQAFISILTFNIAPSHLYDYHEVIWHFKAEIETLWLKFQFQRFSGSLACQKHLLCNFGSYFLQVENGLNKICQKISPSHKLSKI